MWIRHSLEWGVVGAGVTLLTCASNPRPSITILSKVLPPPLWVTIYTIFLHRVHHHLELCSCFFGDCLSPLGEYKCHEGSDTVSTSSDICWLDEWRPSPSIQCKLWPYPITIHKALVPPSACLWCFLCLEDSHLSPHIHYTHSSPSEPLFRLLSPVLMPQSFLPLSHAILASYVSHTHLTPVLQICSD